MRCASIAGRRVGDCNSYRCGERVSDRIFVRRLDGRGYDEAVGHWYSLPCLDSCCYSCHTLVIHHSLTLVLYVIQYDERCCSIVAPS